MKEEIKAYYDHLAPTYDQDRFANTYGQYIHQQEIKVLNNYLQKSSRQHNLDLACGTGRFLDFASVGLDVSKKMIATAQTKFPDKDLVLGDATDLPFAEKTFDHALCFHLFMHLERISMEQILCEVNRVLKPGGHFIFDVPSRKRRVLTGHRSQGWHGGHELDVHTIQEIGRGSWDLQAFYGVAFFPVHRIPQRIRRYFVKLDGILGASVLKEFSSHLIFILKKK